MGSVPQFVDLDHSGRKDLISGSFLTGVLRFRNLGEGKFAKGEPLLLTDGTVIHPDDATAPAFVDWDGNGNLDMVLGTIGGKVWLYRGNGKGQFEKGVLLTSGGKPIQALDGGPSLFDWNGDGIPDLLIGDEAGNLKLYYGLKRGSTDLGPPVTIWKGRDADIVHSGDPARRQANDISPGARLKVTVTDWNGDGKPDLLVGDFSITDPPPKTLTSVENKRKEELSKLVERLSNEQNDITDGLGRSAYVVIGKSPGADLSPSDRQRWTRAYDSAAGKSPRLKKVSMALAKAQSELSVLEPVAQQHGYVWVFLGK